MSSEKFENNILQKVISIEGELKTLIVRIMLEKKKSKRRRSYT